MEKLYTRKTLFDHVFAGKYTLYALFLITTFLYIIPWQLLFEVQWYKLFINWQVPIFPNIAKISDELEQERIQYFIAQKAFTNVVEWPIFFYCLYKVKPADKITSGEFPTKMTILPLIVGIIFMIGSLHLFTSAGTTGGRIVDFLRASDYGLTLINVALIWCAIFGWYLCISIALGLKKNISIINKYDFLSKKTHNKEPHIRMLTTTDNGSYNNDTYLFNLGDGMDQVSDAQGTDMLQFGDSIATDQLWFERSGNDLKVSVIGLDDSVTIAHWYTSSSNQTEQIHTATGDLLNNNMVDQLVNAMAVFSPPMPDQTSLPIDMQDTLQLVIVATWQTA